jgi:hypothetical protein
MTTSSGAISLSAVNSEVGNVSTASVNLNNRRIRSLGGGFGVPGATTPGTTVNMNNLRSKTTNWVINTESFIESSFYASVVMPRIDQDCFYKSQIRVGGPFVATNAFQQFTRRIYINGNSERTSAFMKGTSGSPASVIGVAHGVGPFSTSNYYVCSEGDGQIHKLSPDGTHLASVTVTGPSGTGNVSFIRERAGIVVGSTENIYASYSHTHVASGRLAYYVVSLDSSLNIRWTRVFPPWNPETAALAPFVEGISIDSAENVYVVYRADRSAPTDSLVGVIKYNSSGTELLHRAIRFDRSGTTPLLSTRSRAGIGTSGEIALFTVNGPSSDLYLTYFNNAGTIQWSRNMVFTNLFGYFIGAFDCIMDSANNIYVLAFASGDNNGLKDRLWLVKFNSTGTVQWQRCLDNSIGGAKAINPLKNSLILSGNDNIITVSVVGGLVDDYNQLFYPVMVGLDADGTILTSPNGPPYPAGSYVAIGYATTPTLTITNGQQPTVVTPLSVVASTSTRTAATGVNVAAETLSYNSVYMQEPPP